MKMGGKTLVMLSCVLCSGETGRIGNIVLRCVALRCLGLAWVGLGALGLAWVGLGCLGLPWVALGCIGLHWFALCRSRVHACECCARILASLCKYHSSMCTNKESSDWEMLWASVRLCVLARVSARVWNGAEETINAN
jgi:hypothetical protein